MKDRSLPFQGAKRYITQGGQHPFREFKRVSTRRGLIGGDWENRSLEDLQKFDGQAFTARLYAELLRAAGVDAVITVHNHSIRVQKLFSRVFGGEFCGDVLQKPEMASQLGRGEFIFTLMPLILVVHNIWP